MSSQAVRRIPLPPWPVHVHRTIGSRRKMSWPLQGYESRRARHLRGQASSVWMVPIRTITTEATHYSQRPGLLGGVQVQICPRKVVEHRVRPRILRFRRPRRHSWSFSQQPMRFQLHGWRHPRRTMDALLWPTAADPRGRSSGACCGSGQAARASSHFASNHTGFRATGGFANAVRGGYAFGPQMLDIRMFLHIWCACT